MLRVYFKSIAGLTRHEIFHLLGIGGTALSMTQKGRERFCSANVQPLKVIQDWVKFYERFWDDKLKNLGNYLDQKNSETTTLIFRVQLGTLQS
ncbi:MAG: hypothetical protein MI921_12665 [Cytophagales bacterium]|nr:hypothetical protein [Cytophagales bacterium]